MQNIHKRTLGLGLCLMLGMSLACGLPACAEGSVRHYLMTTTQPSSHRPPEQAGRNTSHPATRSGDQTHPASVDETMEEHVQLITGNITAKARELGAKKLLQSGSEDAVRRLISILQGSSDLAAKRAVCLAIAHFDHPMPSLVDAVLSLLGGHSDGLEDAVVSALRRFDRKVVIPKLRAIARDTVPTGNTVSTDNTTLSSRLSSSKRKSAIKVLGRMGNDLQAVAVLIDLISFPEQDPMSRDEVPVRDAALDALSRTTGIRHRDAASAQAWWKTHRSMTPLQWLKEVNERRMEEIDRLNLENEALSKRLVAAYRGAYLQTPDVDRSAKLLVFLKDDSASIRGLGLDLINALITDRKDIGQEIRAQLVEMISDPDPNIRKSVTIMVGDLRLKAAAVRLEESLTHESDYRIQSAQVAALGRLDDLTAIPVLIDHLNDTAREVVTSAASALGMLARRGQIEAPQTTQKVADALTKRYEQITAQAADAKLPPQHDALRQSFLEAMGRIGVDSCRPLLIKEMSTPGPIQIRRTAIAGLASYGDAAAAKEIRGYLSDSDAEIRLAVAIALGRCGRQKDDLDALLAHIDSGQEAHQAVRDRAWESYLAILQRSAPQQQLSAAAQFATHRDASAQHRCLNLLKSLRSDPARFDLLLPRERLSLFKTMANAQYELSEYSVAAKTLETILEQLQSGSSHASENQTLDVTGRLLSALLRSDQDEAALARLHEYTNLHAAAAEGSAHHPSPLAEVVFEELNIRLSSAQSAAQFAKCLKLIEQATPVLNQIAGEDSQRLAHLKDKMIAKRRALMDKLVARLATDAEAESKLIAFEPALVLPVLYERLSSMPTTTGPADDNEARLIELAKKLMPRWPGYTPGITTQERTIALKILKEGLAKTATPATTIPDSSSLESEK